MDNVTIPGKNDKEMLNWTNSISNWFKTKAFPWMKQVGSRIYSAVCNIHLPALNWGGVLVLVVLAYMAQNGFLDDMPNVKWLLESTLRLIEWIFGLLRTILEWCVGNLETTPFNWGILEMFNDWVKNMFAL